MGYGLYGICAKTLCTPNCYVMKTMADLGESIRVYKEECLEDDVASVRGKAGNPCKFLLQLPKPEHLQ